MLLSDAASDYLLFACHSQGLTDSTCGSYQASLRYFVRWLEANGYPQPDTTALSTPVLRRFLYHESGEGKRPRTIHGTFSAIKALCVFLLAQKALDANPITGIQLPKKDAPNRPVVSDEECSGLLQACERLRTPKRVAQARALFSTLIYTGLRAQEVLDLEVGDVSFDRKTITVRQGKGQKSRTLYPSPESLTAIREWLVVRGAVETSYLFSYASKRRVSYGGLLKMLREIKLIAGYGDREHIQPHACRRALATRLMNRGANIRTIQAALGHSQAQTTLAYLTMSNEAAKPMADLASLHLSPAPKPEPPTSVPSPAPTKPNRASDISRRRRTPTTRTN